MRLVIGRVNMNRQAGMVTEWGWSAGVFQTIDDYPLFPSELLLSLKVVVLLDYYRGKNLKTTILYYQKNLY